MITEGSVMGLGVPPTATACLSAWTPSRSPAGSRQAPRTLCLCTAPSGLQGPDPGRPGVKSGACTTWRSKSENGRNDPPREHLRQPPRTAYERAWDYQRVSPDSLHCCPTASRHSGRSQAETCFAPPLRMHVLAVSLERGPPKQVFPGRATARRDPSLIGRLARSSGPPSRNALQPRRGARSHGRCKQTSRR